jgi:hypothetical protein
MQGRRSAAVLAIVAMIGVGLALHVIAIAGVEQITHDDTISYLAATGHQAQYEQVINSPGGPVARWVPAAQWQSFTRIDEAFPLLTIARDLGHHDIHPPVYFWLLHVWSLLVGVHLWTGPVLNLLIHVLTGVVMWRLARHLVRSSWAAWAVVGVWATLPALAETVASSRQYSLAGLLSITMGAVFIRTRPQARAGGLLALGVVTALGLLTLYTFGVVAAGLGLMALADLRVPARRRTALAQLATFVVSGIVFLVCQPWLREVLARQQEQAEPWVASSRAEGLLTDLPRFAITGLPMAAGVAVLTVTAVLAVLAWRVRTRARPVVWIAVWVPAVLAVLYVSGTSPAAASEARYFSIVLPYVVFLPVLAWPYLRIRPVAALAAGVFVVAAVANVTHALREDDTAPTTPLTGDRPVVLDNLARGVLLRMVWDLPPATPVYAADQATLLRTTDHWLECTQPSPCRDRAVTFASQPTYEATAVGQERILAVADEVRSVTVEPPVDEMTTRYRLSAPIAGVGSSTTGRLGAARTGSIHSGARSRTANTMIPMSTSARSPDAAASISYDPDGVYAARRASHQNSVQ